jgi:sporulation protein YlmC with PRC-barrel domain
MWIAVRRINLTINAARLTKFKLEHKNKGFVQGSQMRFILVNWKWLACSSRLLPGWY